MAMLAEPRRRQKWTLNPRGKQWSDDSNKFGQKMLEKMGWSSGKGLGANLDGMTEHIRAKYKNDQAGVGFSHNDRDKQWTQHQEGFNELLQQLHNGKVAETTAAEKELSGKSLELKSKQSRARVHYQKFTRGKDVNKYSTKDLANIFGKKDLNEKSQESETAVEIKQEPEEPPPAPVGSTDTSHGVLTIKGGSINDYFKNKMSVLGRKITTEVPNDSESESETYAGFGFSSAEKKSETPTKPLETHFSFVNPALDVASPKEAEYTPRKRDNEFVFENPALDIDSPKDSKNNPRKRKSEFVFENPALDIDSPKDRKNTPRKRKSEFVFENPALDIDSPKDSKNTPRKRKNDFVFDNPALKLGDSTPEMEHTPKRRRSEFAFENGSHELESPQNGGASSIISGSGDITKKKRKKKVKEEISAVVDGFTNEALNLESRDDEVSSSSQFEVPRACLGLANNALDLTDETNGRKRVTFNETIEYDTDVASGKRKKKKNKNGGKLDKFEVDNEKMKRKKKKERKDEVAESAFVNEAMDVDPVSQEANENAANERKSERARRKRDRRMSNLETIVEAPEEEKEGIVEVVTLNDSLVGVTGEDFEVLSLETPKKINKKKRKSREAETSAKSQQDESLVTTIDISEEDIELVEEVLYLESESSKKKSKKNKKLRDEQTAGKKSKITKKTPVAYEPEAMQSTDVQEETMVKVEKLEKEERKKKTVNEESKENMDTENVEAENSEKVESAKKKKKKKKKQRIESRECGAEGGPDKIEEDGKKPAEEEYLENGAQSPWDDQGKKSKRTFKALFARSPVVNFVGSNINDIKGYGMDWK